MGVFPKWITGLSAACVAFGSPILIKEWFIEKYTNLDSLKGKTVIVTGGTSGIGHSLVEELAKRKAKVIITCKNENDCIIQRRKIVIDTKNQDVYCSKLDLASLESIREFAKRINEKVENIDILVNNAAIMRLPKRELTKEGFEMQLGVNHLGHFLLTNLLLEKLKKNPNPTRIINVTCTDYKNGAINFDDLNSKSEYDPSKAFKQSKLANILFSNELAKLTKHSNINVFTVDPNNCRTAIKRNLDYYNSPINGSLAKGIFWLIEFSANQGAQTLLYAALSPDISDKSFSGKYIRNSKIVTPILPEDHEVLAKKLWLVSEKWTRIK